MISPVQFIVQMNTQVLVGFHNLYVRSLDVHWCRGGVLAPSDVHHQLGLSCVELEVVPLEVVPLAPEGEVLRQLPVLPVILVGDGRLTDQIY